MWAELEKIIIKSLFYSVENDQFYAMDSHLHMGKLRGNGEREREREREGGGREKKTEWRHLLAELDANQDVAYHTF